MMHTKNIPMRVGGAVLITYKERESTFEREMGEALLDAGDLR